MTENEFVLCSILLIKKYEGKLWGEVFPECWIYDSQKLVSYNTFQILYRFDSVDLTVCGNCVVRLGFDGRIIVYKDDQEYIVLNYKEFLEYFKIPSEDIV